MSSDPFASQAQQAGSTAPVSTVQVHALSAGHLKLPEDRTVRPATPGVFTTVPVLCFLIQHRDAKTGATTRIVFDLGIRRDLADYAEFIRPYIVTREPMVSDPDVVKSLAAGGLTPGEIDYVVLSHLHWDHVGDPREFPSSTFIVGPGALDVLDGRHPALQGLPLFYDPAELLDLSRTIQLSDPPKAHAAGDGEASAASPGHESSPSVDFSRPWKPLGDLLPSTLDVFGDGSVHIVDAPGHFPGHINLLARVGDAEWVYLAGDACHDRRILRNEREIGDWLDEAGRVCCIHADRADAEETIQRARALEEKGVEVILAHDVEWENEPRNRLRFFGAGQ